MNYWKSPESNPVKIILVLVLLAIAGYFVYAASHKTSLEDTAKVVSLNPGSTAAGSGTSGTNNQQNQQGGTGTKGQGGEGGDGRCLDSAPGSLVPALGPAITVTDVYTGTGVGGHNQGRGAFTLTNPGPCPVKVTKMTYVLNTNFLGGWTPVQNIRLMHAGVQFGTTLPFPTADATLCAASNARCVMTFTDPTGVVVAPGATELFRVWSDALNISPAVTPSGAPVTFAFALEAFTSVNPATSGIFNWVTSGAPIQAGTVTVHM